MAEEEAPARRYRRPASEGGATSANTTCAPAVTVGDCDSQLGVIGTRTPPGGNTGHRIGGKPATPLAIYIQGGSIQRGVAEVPCKMERRATRQVKLVLLD